MDHGVFSANIINGKGQISVGTKLCEDIEIEESGLEHEDVCSFVFIKLRFAQGGSKISRSGLIAGAVAFSWG